MSTNFKAIGTPTAPSPKHELSLNGFHLELSADTFSARRMALPDNKQLRDLRAQHTDWFIYWREGHLYAVPHNASPGTTIGEPDKLRCSEHLLLIVALIDALLPKKFPGYNAFRRHPFVFAGKKDELVAASAAKLRNKPLLLKYFIIRPTFIRKRTVRTVSTIG